MSIWRSRAVFVVGAAALCAAVLLLGLAARVWAVIDPPRQAASGPDFDAMQLSVSPQSFPSLDGVELSGWWIEGRSARPPVILCHDLGSSKAALIKLGITLHDAGFPVFLFDFRDHGESEGRRSTLGLKEKRDVLGAVDHLARLVGPQGKRFGVYGVGMGAHAAVLAAADRPSIRVLVLDGLYPDVAYPLVRRVYGSWDLGVERLSAVPVAVFNVLSGSPAGREEAAGVLGSLTGRDMLLLAPAGDSALAGEMERMYEAIPVQTDVDGNLVVLPATQSVGLYGENLDRHHERVAEFFRSRLAPSS